MLYLHDVADSSAAQTKRGGGVGKLSRVTLFSFMWTMMTVVVLNYGAEMRYKDQKTFISAVKLDNLTLRV